jgi:hypothetical protein
MTSTPNNISNLKTNEIFVFGSNEAGIHGAGAARLAYEKFGAVWGKGIGLYGQSYAIPTKDRKIETLKLSVIKIYVRDFLIFADNNPKYTFLVTQIGCGLAGYKPEQIAPFFASIPENVILPKEFQLPK